MVMTGKCNHIQCRPIGSKFEVVWQYYHVKHAHIHMPPFPPPSPCTPPPTTYYALKYFYIIICLVFYVLCIQFAKRGMNVVLISRSYDDLVQIISDLCECVTN